MARERLSTLAYALLSVLARRESSGYDISRHMQVPIGFFWQAKRSQIYPELQRLQALGLVTNRRVEQEDRPDKKVYAITSAGREALRRWVVEPPAVAPSRDEFVLKAYSLWLVDPQEALDLFRREEERHRRQLELYQAELEDLKERFGPDLRRADAPWFGNYLAVHRGIGYEREYMQWCGWVIEQLASRE